MPSMTVNNAAKIQKAFEKFAKRIEAFGIAANMSDFKNDGVVLSFKVVAAFGKPGEKIETQAEKQAKYIMPSYGLKPEIVGQTFVGSRGPVCITGLAPNARSNVIQITFRGKPNYRCSPEYVHQTFSADPNFAKFVIKDFDKSRLPKRQRRRRSFSGFEGMFGGMN